MAKTTEIKVKLTDDDVLTAEHGETADGREILKFSWYMEVLIGEREGTVILQPRSSKGILGSEAVECAPL